MPWDSHNRTKMSELAYKVLIYERALELIVKLSVHRSEYYRKRILAIAKEALQKGENK